MVAIVSGSALGLNLGSNTVLGSNGAWGMAGFGRAGERVYVNAATGNLVIQGQDELLAGPGLNAAALRTYNSQAALVDDNKDNWLNGPLRRLRLENGPENAVGSVVVRRDEDCSETTFTWDAGRNCYISTDGAGAHDTLNFDVERRIWTLVDGSSRRVEQYSAGTRRLLYVRDADGNALELSYSLSGLLKSVTTSAGEVTSYSYNSSRQLTQLSTTYRSGAGASLDTSLTRMRYGYDAAGRLSAVTVDLTPDNSVDGQFVTTRYTYDGSSQRVATISQDDGSQLSFTYDESGRVKTITDALGGVSTLGYDSVNRRTTYQDALGQTTTYWYDAQGQLKQVDSPAVAGVVSSTKYAYNANGDVTSITDAENRSVSFELDERGNVVRQMDSAGHVVRRLFNAQNQLLCETVATQGEPASGTAAARYVYDAGGVRLRYVISAEGRVTEYRYNSFGLRTASIQYAGAQYTLNGLSYDSVPTEAELTTWVSGQDLSKTLRVDSSYDWRGQLQTETRYASVDAAGNGVLDGTQAVTQYVYGTAGQLLKTIDARNGVTQYTYDGLGRMLTSTNALNQVSTTSYDDLGGKVTTRSYAGLSTTTSFDRLGRVIHVQLSSADMSDLGQTRRFYDAASRLRMTQDALGARQWYFYDADGRRQGEVNALGQLTEYVHNKAGQITQTIAYAQLVNLPALVDANGQPAPVSMADIRPTASDADRKSWNAYDSAGRLAKAVSPLGEVTEYSYDASGRLLLTRRYANAISTASLGRAPSPGEIAPTSSSQDQILRSFYDNDGLAVGKLDGTGLLNENQYDAAARLVAKVQRAQLTGASPFSLATASATASATGLAQVRPGASSKDQQTLSFYDARGQLVGQLDAEGYFSETIYDASGNVAKTLRYAVKTYGLGASTALASVRSAAGGIQTQTVYAYDAVNRVLQTRVDPNGLNLTTTTAYDDASKQLFVTNAAGVTTVSQLDAKGRVIAVTVDPSGLNLITRYRYDAQDQLVSSTDAQGVVTLYTYDPLGRKASQTLDPTGLKLCTTYSYDPQGQLARVVDPAGQATHYVHDKNGRLQYELDPANGLTEHRYDALGNRVRSIRYADKQSGLQTTDVGSGLISNRMSSVVANASRDLVTTFSYDALGRKATQTVDPEGLRQVTTYSYDAQGQLARVTDPAGLETRYVYDRIGRLQYELDPANGLTEYRYDAMGNRVQIVQYAQKQEGIQTVDIGKDLVSHVVNAITPDAQKDRITSSSYDAAGREVRRLDAGNTVTDFEYDLMGRVTSRRVYASGATPGAAERMLYDRAGRLRYQIDAQGKTVEHVYDAAGRRVETIEYARPQDLAALEVVPSTRVMNDASTPASNWFIFADAGDGSTMQRVTDAQTGKQVIARKGKSGFQLGTGKEATWMVPGSVISWEAKFQDPVAFTVVAKTTRGTTYISYQHGDGAPELRQLGGGDVFVTYRLGPAAMDGQWHRYTRDFRADLAALDPAAEILSVQTFWVGSNGGQGELGYIGDVTLSTGANELQRSNAAYEQFTQRSLRTSPADRHRRHAFDAVGRMRFEVDALGYATEYKYSAAGQLIETLKHTQPLGAPGFARGTRTVDWSVYEAVSSGASVSSVFDEERQQPVIQLAGNGTRTFFGLFAPGQGGGSSWDAKGTLLSWDMKIAEDFYVTIGLDTDQGLRHVQYVPAQAGATDAGFIGLGRQSADGRWHRYTRDLQADLAQLVPGAKILAVRHFELRGSGRVADISLQPAVTEVAAQTLSEQRIDFSDPEAQKQLHYNKAGEWSPEGYMLLKSFAQEGGSWAAMDKYDWYKPGTPIRVGIKPRDLQGFLHVMIQGGSAGTPSVYQRMGIVMCPNGRVLAQSTDSKGDVHNLDVGGYEPGTAYVVEFETHGKGGTVYMYAEGSTRGSGLSHTVEGSWIGHGISFAVARDATQTLTSTAELHYIEIGTSSAPIETRQVNDKLGRPIYVIDAQGAVTQTEYDSASRVVARRRYAHAIGLADLAQGEALTAEQVAARLRPQALSDQVEYFAYDNAGRVRFAVDGQGDVSEYRYDTAGRLAHTLRYDKPLALNGQAPSLSMLEASVAGLGEPRVTSQVLDAAGRVLYSVDALGVVTQNSYDSLGQLNERKVWAQPLASTVSQRLSKPLLAEDLARALQPSGEDRLSRYVYSPRGELLYEQDPLGAVTARRYDAQGRLLESVQYAKPLSTSLALSPQAFQGALASTPSQDLLSRSVYDATGRLRYSIDAQGSVRELRYDGLGRVVRRIDWDQRIDLARIDDRSDDRAVEALLPKTSAQARETVFGYDALDRQVFVLDAEGGLVEQVFDGLGQVLQRIAYDKPATDAAKLAAVRAQPSVAALRSLVQGSPGADRVERRSYDSAGRLTRQVDAEGGVTAYAYDSFGNLTEQLQFAQALSSEQMAGLPPLPTQADIDTVVRSHAADRRTNHRYDAANRLRYTIDAHGGVTEHRYLGLETQTVRYRKLLTDRSTLPEATPGEDLISSSFADLAGRLERSVDAAGVVTRYRYNAMGQLREETRAAGLPEASTTRYEFDNAGRMKAKTVAVGTAAAATTGYEYNALGQLVCETDPRGMALARDNTAWARDERVRRHLPEDAGALTAAQRETAMSSYATRHAYDKLGRRTSTTNALGGTTETQYDVFGNAVKITDPLGNAGHFYYDRLGRVTLQVDPMGHATETTYWGAGSKQVGAVRRFFVRLSGPFDAQNRPAPSPHAKDQLTQYRYDRLDRLVQTEDAEHFSESVQFGLDGNRFDKQVTNKLNGTAQYRHDKLGQLVSETMPVRVKGVPVRNLYEYDTLGNRVKQIEAAGLTEQRTTLFRYDKLGRMTHRIGSAVDAYDPQTRQKIKVTPVEQTGYDALGNVIETITRAQWDGSQAQGGSRTLNYFDAAGRQVMQVKPDGAVTCREYDPAGAVLKESALSTRLSLPAVAGGQAPLVTRDAQKDRVTHYRYDSLGRLSIKSLDSVLYYESQYGVSDINVAVPAPSAVVLQQLVYDAAGNVVQELDGRGNSIYNYYDRLGRKVLCIDQEGYATRWAFDDIADVATTQTRFAQRVMQFGRQDDGSVVPSLRDPGLLCSGLSKEGARITTCELDRMGRVTEQRILNVKNHSVNDAGVVSESVTDAITIKAYNGLGLLKQVRQLADGASQHWLQTDIEYDALGREVARLEPGFVDFNGQEVRPQTHTEYNGIGAQSRVIRRGTDAASELDDRITTYEYNANGDRIRITDAMGAVTDLELNAQGLVGRSISRLVLDADGRREDLVRQYSYDAMGRVLSEREDSTNTLRRYQYNAFGELTAKGLGQGGYHESIDYNTLGKIERSNSGNGSTRLFLYDRNGNATREIFSNNSDLSSVALQTAACDGTLSHRISVYDKRNQLVQTIEPRMEAMTSTSVSNSGVFTERSVLLSGGFNLNQTGGGVYSPGNQTGGTGFKVDVITGGGDPYPPPGKFEPGKFASGTVAPSALTVNAPSAPSMGAAWIRGDKRPVPQTTTPQVTLQKPSQATAEAYGTTWGVPGNYPTLTGNIYIPSDWPQASQLEFKVIKKRHDGSNDFRKAAEAGKSVEYDPYWPGEFSIIASPLGGPDVTLATGFTWFDVEPNSGPTLLEGDIPLERSDTLMWGAEIRNTDDRWLIFNSETTASTEVVLGGQQLPVLRSGSYVFVKLSMAAIPASGSVTLSVRDAGTKLSASNYALSLKDGDIQMAQLGPIVVASPEVVVANSNTISAPGFPGAALMYVRRVGSGGSWIAHSLPTPWSGTDRAGNWEFMIERSGAFIRGEFSCSPSGVVTLSGDLYNAVAQQPSLILNVGAPSALEVGKTREVKLSIGGADLGRYDVGDGNQVSIPWTTLENALGVDRFSVRTPMSYTAEVFTKTNQARIGTVSGSIRFSPDGSNGGSGNTASGAAAAWIRLAGGARAGNVDIYRSGVWLKAVALSNSDSCQIVGSDAWLNLSGETGSTGQLDLQYRQPDYAYAVAVQHAGGQITSTQAVAAYYGKVRPGISIDGLGDGCTVEFTVKQSGGDTWVPTGQSIDGGGFYWDVPWNRMGRHEFSFTVKNSTGTVISQGNGAFTASGTSGVVFEPIAMGSTPKWSEKKYSAGSVGLDVRSATKLALEIYRQGSSAPWKSLNLTAGDGLFSWEIGLLDAGSYTFKYVATDAAASVVSKGSGSYTVDAEGKVSMQLVTDKRPASLKFSPPGDAKRLEFKLWKKGAPEKIVMNQVLFKDSNWQLNMPEGLAAGDYEYAFTVRNLDGKDGVLGDIVGRGHGSFTAAFEGALTELKNVQERLPLGRLTFGLKGGRTSGTHLRLSLTPQGGGASRTVVIPGSWSSEPAPGAMNYEWVRPFGDDVIDAELRFSCEAEVLDSQGRVLADETGDALRFKDLTLVVAPAVGDTAVSSARFEQRTQVLAITAQVSMKLNYNAFGEISEEFDDRVFERAVGMVQFYAKEGLGQFDADPTKVRTQFEYNALGKLLEKRDAQTFETLANGGVRRINPSTRYGYDLSGRLVSVTDANGHLQRQRYVGGGERQIARQWAGDGGLKRNEYDVFGDTRRQINELAVTLKLDYDKLSRLITQTRTGVNRVANFHAGEFAGVQAVASELVDRFEYDELGRRIKRTDALNGVSATWYDAQDRVKQTRTAEGFLTRYEYRYVDAGAAGEDAIFGAGGRSVGGYVQTTSGPDGLQQIDRFDHFSNKSSRVDLGGNRYQYRYNHAGLLEGQTSSRGQNIVYKYVGNGLVESIRDLTEGTLTQYAYDDAGNRIREMYGQLGADKITAGLVYQSSALQYDELGRLARVSDVLGGDEGNSQKSHLIRHEYDAVGNRRAVIALYWDPVTRSFLQRDDNWYTYDAANRFKTTMGSLIGARGAADTKIDLGARGKFVDYDKAGQRTSVKHADGKQEEYRYSSDGYLEEVYVNGLRGALRRVDALGRTVQYREWVPGGTVVRQTKLSSYSIDGRLLQEVVSDTEDSNGTTRYFYYSAGKNNDQGQTSQYAAGALARTEQISAPKEGTATTTRTYYSYEYLDTAKKKEIKVQGAADGVANWAPGFSRMGYNTNGHLREADSTDGRRLLYYSNAEGLTLLRRELLDGVDTGLRREYFFANGRQVGDVSTDPRDREQRRSYAEELAQPLTQSGKAQDRYRNLRPITSVDFDQNYEPVNSRYPAAVPGSYTVQRGDTLQGIARALWGDGAMWYLIAEANGLLLDATTELPAKLVLSIPNKVTNIHNNASTFRVYNPGEAMGHVDPTLPDPPPPPDDEGCGFVGDLIMIAVAVAVTVYLGPGAGGSVLEFAAAAAAGSAASQAVGIAIGHIDRFDWSAVAQAALTGAVTAGVNAGLKDLAKAGVLGETVGSWVQSSTSWQGAAIRASASTAVNMAIRGEWSWRAVAASAVSAGAGAAVGEQLASVLGNTDGARIATSALSAAAGGWASSQVLGLNRQQTMAVVGQGFVQGLGNAIGESLASPKLQGEGPWSDLDYRNGGDVEDDIYQARKEALYGLGGTGARLGSSTSNAVANWSRDVDRGIRDKAQALLNFDEAVAKVSAQEDAEAAVRRQAWLVEQHAAAKAYGRQLDLAAAAKIQGLTRYSAADRLADGNYMLALESQERIARSQSFSPTGRAASRLIDPDVQQAQAMGMDVEYDVSAGRLAGPQALQGTSLAARAWRSDHEIKLGGALYLGVGGNAELTMTLNPSRLDLSATEFEWGLGFGFGAKVKGGLHSLSEQAKTVTAPQWVLAKFGNGQADGTGALSVKTAIEVSAPGMNFALAEARFGVQSPVTGAPTNTPSGGFYELKFGEFKAAPTLQFGATAKIDLFNNSYKRTKP